MQYNFGIFSCFVDPEEMTNKATNVLIEFVVCLPLYWINGKYVTDYILAVFMTYACVTMALLHGKVQSLQRSTESQRLLHLQDMCLATSGLFGCYAVSVLAGGLSHQFFTTLDMLNSFYFRVMWTITVGNVSAAGGFIGFIGACMGRYFASSRHWINSVPLLSGLYWEFWGCAMTVAVLFGAMSFFRPACDIFIAGTTQFCATAYVCLILVTRMIRYDANDKLCPLPVRNKEVEISFLTAGARSEDASFEKVRLSTRIIFIVAFLGNAPLLPLYPELLSTGMDLGTINTILHCWLCTTWGTQFISLKQIVESQL